jgi:type VI secretion system protein VasD
MRPLLHFAKKALNRAPSWIAVVCGVLAIGACKRKAPSSCEPGEIHVAIHTSSRVNLDSDKRSLPTQVRVFELVDSGSFEAASFDEIWLPEGPDLGEDLLLVEKHGTYPGETLNMTLPRVPEARYFGVSALYRRPAGQTWKARLPLPPPRACGPETKRPKIPVQELHVYLEDYELRVSEMGPVIAPELAPAPRAEDSSEQEREPPASDEWDPEDWRRDDAMTPDPVLPDPILPDEPAPPSADELKAPLPATKSAESDGILSSSSRANVNWAGGEWSRQRSTFLELRNRAREGAETRS